MNLEDRLSLFGDVPAAEPYHLLANLRTSLTQAFGAHMMVALQNDELELTMGAKTAWINSEGILTGESFTPSSSE